MAAQTPDVITVEQVNDFLASSRAQLAAGNKRFDLSAVCRVDSTALAALLALRRDGECEFVNPSANLLKLATLYGVETLLFSSV